MKAIAIEQFGELDQLKMREIPTPEPKSNEVQIKVAYAGVNPVDWKICTGMYAGRAQYDFPIVLGWDVSGVVSKAGSDVTNLKEGDEVFACTRKAQLKDGCYAEYVCFDAEHVVKKPANVTFAEASALPIGSLSAWQALHEAAKLKKGESILILAGAGGVGSLAIQIAHYMKATVLTTTREKNNPYVKKMGAKYAIDYLKEDVVETTKKHFPEGVDVLLDCIGGTEISKYMEAIKPGGRLVTIVAQPDVKKAEKHKIDVFYVSMRPDGQQLKMIAKLFENETLKPIPVEEFPLENAKEALLKVKEGHVHGKIVLKV